ncbi:MAG: HIT domain-containing protein [gamma proteobacterium symbiont of Bathyaustriella thionipta]|nr:HIT domain-containing protein [gamma proteobacterium symbiont of Bathyaustriella thionipta]MCU7950740.1 HIT domain-containing protein [gamma proteobacterium symbiont of Bathyaustriella thionipta]MCU7952435.1 HIT domain-containing protein [gamma proteobacterium symbiont of Bathyaustriella thionipta]MCU7957231.1 HIT domain-containing protein [gamma proteobacterium symbiont of Bathyaustriella thionipta]MCU7968761.1 HIT domain-containing protein [gamma proteobacterium symbiont of Bathyaustriella
MNKELFTSNEEFRHIFEQGLVKLLDYDGLGIFILVLANASFDQHVHDFTHTALLEKYKQLAKQYCFLLQDGQLLTEPEDDILVFLKLMAMGIDKVSQTEFRHTRQWELQFNHIRSLRPARMSKNVIEGIHLEFNPDGFHFNKPFLQKESYWDGLLNGKHLDIFYNKFPFARFHSLLVPDKEACLPQYLSHEYHQYIWQITEQLGEHLNGVGMAYNSYGAFSSINHLHFHLFIKEHPLPVSNLDWTHNGGTKSYPIECKVFHSIELAWDFIQQLHTQQISYNLIYLPGIVYCLPRKHQGTYDDASWSSGFAWYEVSGGFTTFNHTQFMNLDCQQLEDELSLLRIDS